MAVLRGESSGKFSAEMPKTHEEERPDLEIRRYPNRRFYDTTHSKHLSLQRIHQAILEGHDVRVVDAKTEEDITARVLTQILLEYEPLKLKVFSRELLTRAIRVNDSVLKEFVDVYFRQAFEAFCGSQRQFEDMLRQAHHLTSMFTRPANWAGGFVPPWGVPSTPPEAARSAGESTDALRDELKALRKELSELQEDVRKRDPAPQRTKGA